MPAAFALMSAMLVGSADFWGGLASRRAPVPTVVMWSQMVGVVLMSIIAVIVPATATATDLVYGAVSGVVGSAAVLALYRGFVTGRTGVVAPVSAVVAAGVPVPVGLALGERPGQWALVGAAIGLAAIAIVTREEPSTDRDGPSGLRDAIAAGVGFAAMFVVLSRAGAESGMWPVLANRVAGVVVMGAVALGARHALALPRPARGPTVACGMLAATGNGMFLAANQVGGMLSMVAVLTSLYPVATVMWARGLLGERIGASRAVGLVCAVVAVALMAIGS